MSLRSLKLPLLNNINNAIGVDVAIDITYEEVDNSVRIHKVTIPSPENTPASNYIIALLSLLDQDILEGLVVTYINTQMQKQPGDSIH